MTLENQYPALSRAYEYFRVGAELAYKGEGRESRKARSPLAEALFDLGGQEGWWNTHAMIVAYFSRLEFVLLVCLLFQDPGSAGTDLTDFLEKGWREKFKRVFDTSTPGGSKTAHDTLLKIAEDYRNPFSHGGVDKDGATLHVQLPGIGVAPAVLGGITQTPHFHLLPMSRERYEELCATLDGVDSWLAGRDGSPLAVSWLEAGLDIRFDKQFTRDLGAALASGKFDQFMKRCEGLQEQAANMDW